jgi:hypothetical protein
MQLSDYPISELQTLLLGISLGKTAAQKFDKAFEFNQLNKWADRINEAIRYAQLKQSQTPNIEPLCGSLKQKRDSNIPSHNLNGLTKSLPGSKQD